MWYRLVLIYAFMFNSSAQSLTLTERVLFQYSKSVSLSCNISSPVKFFVNNTEASIQKYEINSTTLTIKQIKKLDILNMYFCNNTAGDRVNFEKDISPRLYKVDYMAVFGVSGTQTKLSCYLLVGSENNQTVEWSWKNSNGIILNSTNSQYKIVNGNESSTFTLLNSDTNDSGNYECTVKNLYGNHSRITKLGIKSNLAPLWPFLGTVGQFVILAIILFYYEFFVKKEIRLFKRQKTAPLSLTDTRSVDSKSSSSETELIHIENHY